MISSPSEPDPAYFTAQLGLTAGDLFQQGSDVRPFAVQAQASNTSVSGQSETLSTSTPISPGDPC